MLKLNCCSLDPGAGKVGSVTVSLLLGSSSVTSGIQRGIINHTRKPFFGITLNVSPFGGVPYAKRIVRGKHRG